MKVDSCFFNILSFGLAKLLSNNLGREIEPVIVKEESRSFDQSFYEYGFSIRGGMIRYFTADPEVIIRDGHYYLKKYCFKKVPNEFKSVIIDYYSIKYCINKKLVKNCLKDCLASAASAATSPATTAESPAAMTASTSTNS